MKPEDGSGMPRCLCVGLKKHQEALHPGDERASKGVENYLSCFSMHVKVTLKVQVLVREVDHLSK